MFPYAILCIGAGIASAALFLAALMQPFAAFILMFLAPLPLFIIGFGWGGLAAAFSALVGALAMGMLLGGINGISFLISIGLAPVLLSYLAAMTRSRSPASEDDAGDVEWYPVGHLVLWSAGVAGTLVAGFILLAGVGGEDYAKTAMTLLQKIKEADPRVAEAFGSLSDAEVETYFSFIVRLVPVVAAAGWTLASVCNIWIASKVVQSSGAGTRPWPPFPKMSFPRVSSMVFGAVLVMTLLPGTPGRIAEGYAAALVCAFAVLGLAVLHDISRKLDGRILILTTGYLAMVMFNWLAALLFAALGVAETGFNLRQRVSARLGGPKD